MSDAFRIFSSLDGFWVSPAESPSSACFLGPDFSPDQLFALENPHQFLSDLVNSAESQAFDPQAKSFRPVIENQEVWASGVTYFRSRTARMEEAESAGGDVFYDKVYEAERPELFFKSTAAKTRGHGDDVCIRADSTWDVPEPELTLAINSAGKIFGYTIGNDMSSRSIEGENPLYLPQAKSYTGACALGPCLLVTKSRLADAVPIRVEILRAGEIAFEGETDTSQIKRGFDELAGFLFRANEFPTGAYLMTGTGIVPDAPFTLKEGDVVNISIGEIGTLTNPVVKTGAKS